LLVFNIKKQLVRQNKEQGERRRRQVLYRQAKVLVYKVFNYFKHEIDAGMPVHDVAKEQERTAEACNSQYDLEECKKLLVRTTSQFVFLSLHATRLRSWWVKSRGPVSGNGSRRSS
jgi:hypothetical protein